MVSTLKKLRDWNIKGFQLQMTYFDDWEEMKKTFFLYGLDINIHGPLITLNEAKIVRMSRIITQELSEKFNLKKKDIFLVILRALPMFARIKAEKEFKIWIENNLLQLHEIMKNGTMKETDKEFEKKVRYLLGK